ncbi:serine hydrolase domain-containing protein [Schaalia naturae]|uniref:Serine hydrolase domain-containing protein n=1 Tax=Schaalia naturae TaxID=635203 RepID=A0ABW2SNN7_9ACTO
MIDFSPFRLSVAEQHLGVSGVHVLHRDASSGRRIGEEHRFRSDDRVCLYSASKTFTAAGVGIAMGEGLLTAEDRLLDAFPEYRDHAGEGVGAITVRHLLTMTSGSPDTWFGPGQLEAEDRLGAFLATPLAHEPGAFFEYSNACTYALGRLVERRSGQDLRDYLVPRLFDRLGIANPQWHRCPRGHSLAASGLFLTTSELARLGETLLDGGSFRGTRVIPRGFVDAMHADWVDTRLGRPDREVDPEGEGYGLQVWRCTVPGAWRADGKYGQFSVVLPEQDACVTLTSHFEGAIDDILRAVWRDILPQL